MLIVDFISKHTCFICTYLLLFLVSCTAYNSTHELEKLLLSVTVFSYNSCIFIFLMPMCKISFPNQFSFHALLLYTCVPTVLEAKASVRLVAMCFPSVFMSPDLSVVRKEQINQIKSVFIWYRTSQNSQHLKKDVKSRKTEIVRRALISPGSCHLSSIAGSISHDFEQLFCFPSRFAPRDLHASRCTRV